MLDMLIVNGTVIDGSGAPVGSGSIGIKDGKIVRCQGDELAGKTIDAANRLVCPGFIDAHSHGDKLLGTEDGRLFKTPQGITTELCGQCGSSVASESAVPGAFERFLDKVSEMQMSANAKFYVGHNSLRRAVMGTENRAATKQELENMKSMLREAMESGAAGLSTGLIYVPGCYADENEVVALAKVIEPFQGVYASHMRNESYGVVDAVKETIDIGRRAGVRVDISHHKMLGKDNWGRQKETLALIEKANEEGVYTTCDQYPYPRNMTGLSACMPNWHLADGKAVLTKRLSDRMFRTQLRREMEDPQTPYDNYYRNAGGWEGVYITSAAKTPEAAGYFVAEYAEMIGKDPWEAYFDLMAENDCTMGGVFCSMCEEDMCDIIRSPYCVVGTDGCTISWKHKGHPRASATFPHAINFYVKQKKILTLEQMIHKMTGLTAERLLVPNKGLLREGYDADILIIDYERLKDLATYDEPNQLTEGMDYVIVNGKIVYHNMEFTGDYSGTFVRHTGGK